MTGADPRRGPIVATVEQVLDSAPDGVVIVDPSGRIRLMNRRADAMFGYDHDELLGQLVEVLVPAGKRAGHGAHRVAFDEAPRSRAMDSGIELVARRKDGSEFPVDISLSSLETDEGALVSAAVRDITERQRIEAERARFEKQLQVLQLDEQRVGLEARLHQAQRLETVGELAGGIAHDFNNLLGGIMNYAGLAGTCLEQAMADKGLADEPAFIAVVDDIAEITKVAQRAATLTRQLLIFSRRDVVKLEVIVLNAIVADVEPLLRRTIGENLELSVVLADDLPSVRADRGQIEQVLMNLVVNARDAMPDGGRLGITTEVTEVVDDELGMLPDGPYVRLTVSDTGVGMGADVIERAFEPFFTTKPKGSGSGLGLATVYGIATQAGGDVTIESHLGSGSALHVRLPVTAGVPAPDETEPKQALEGRGETILLVEDEDIIRIPVCRKLIRHGYEVLDAPDAATALHIARAHVGGIDLVLTDVVMARGSGKDLADEVVLLMPDVAVLFMSGYSYDVIVHEGALDPGALLIEKPFTAQKLLRSVRDALDARHGADPRAGGLSEP